MVYETYSSLVSRSRTHLSSLTALGEISVVPGGAIQLWSRDVAARAWEKLGEVGLWTPSGGAGEGRGRFVRCEVGLVELSGVCERGKLLNSAMRSWSKEGI
jgi:Origin recognition complex (ORC) subunit 4 C-terminus